MVIGTESIPILAEINKLKYYMHTPRRNAVPLLRQFSAKIFVAFRASCMLAPEAITAQTMAPAEEPASGVVSYVNIKKTIRILKIYRMNDLIQNSRRFSPKMPCFNLIHRFAK